MRRQWTKSTPSIIPFCQRNWCFATVKHRQRKTKGNGSRLACLTMVFKLMESAAKKWRLLNGSQIIPDIIDFDSVRQLDGVQGALGGHLLRLHKQTRHDGRQLAVCGLHAPLVEMFHDLLLDVTLEVYSTADLALTAMRDGTHGCERLTVKDRCRVAVIAFAFWAIFTALFGLIFACGEPLEPLRKYPLDPAGWFVVRHPGGEVVREANILDMIKAKYFVLLFLAGYVGVIVLSAYVLFLGVIGKRSFLTRYVLRELSSDKSFRLTG